MTDSYIVVLMCINDLLSIENVTVFLTSKHLKMFA